MIPVCIKVGNFGRICAVGNGISDNNNSKFCN